MLSSSHMNFEPNFSSPVFTQYLQVDHTDCPSDWNSLKLLSDLSSIIPDVSATELYEIETKRDDASIYTDKKFVVVTCKKNLTKQGKPYQVMYVEAIPESEPQIFDALNTLAVLQLYVVRKAQVPTFSLVNLYRIAGGFKVTTNFSNIQDLNNEENFQYEVICTNEQKTVISKKDFDDQAPVFPNMLLNLFAGKKFPGKFAIVGSFSEGILLLNDKISKL